MKAILRASLLAPLLAVVAASQEPLDELEFFETRVRPVLAERCQGCHGPTTARAGLRLDHLDFALRGGQSGPALVRGEPLQSRLVRAVRYQDVALRMPPRGRLPDAEIATLERWIERGAFWPDEPLPAARDDASEPEVFPLAERRAAHWSWRPIEDPPVPRGGARHPVDAFLERAQRSRGLEPGPLADRATAIRRLSFDLLGLPPTPAEVDAFLADGAPDAWERLVDRTLASPRFGERWARHWLDLVRYAESCGHEFDYPIPHAEGYRDYVVRAWNDDVPYDQFVREHVAGDLLPEPRRHAVEDYDESILGTGFWHFAQATHAPVDVRQDEAERVDNQIDVLTKTVLGLTVACARCHDHKFDAITTADYYALAGFLQSSRRQVAFLDPGRRIERGVAAIEARHDARRDQLLARLPRFDAAAVAARLLAVDAYLSPRAPAVVVVEAETMSVRERTAGRFRPQPLRGDGWSDGQHMWWTDAGPGDRLVLGFSVAKAGRHELALALTKARDYAIVRVQVDGVPTAEPIDLYDPNVVPTGPLFLGAFDLVAGEHRLGIEILGANPAAVASHMVGIDRLRIERVAADAAEPAPPDLAAVAAEHELDPEELGAWVAGFERVPERGHPLSPWARVARRDRAWEEERAEFDGGERAASDTRPGEIVFATFDRGYDGWYRSGHAFGDRPTARGDHRLEGDRVELLAPGVAHSGRCGGRPRGALRSETFVIEKRGILYRAAGTGGRIRVIIDSYVMDEWNALLFGGITFEVKTDGAFRWFHQRGDLAKFVGHRAHLEILDEGDGWIAVDEIRFSDHGPPPEEDPELRSGSGSRAEVALRTGEAFTAALERFRVGGGDERDLAVAAFALEAWRGGGDAEGDERAFAEGIAEQRALQDALPTPLLALASQDGTGEDEVVFLRGKHQNPGPRVPRRFLEALAGPDQEPILEGSGRLVLAERLLARSNPYPARVVANRLWQHLFGEGIVPTPDNFGVLGRLPTHPELLDWLAVRLRDDHDWSLKTLLRLLVTSEAYRRSSALRAPEVEARDPRDETWHRARVRRLEGEPLRDAMLFVAGTLRDTMYGESIGTHLTPFMQGRGRPRGGPLDGAGRRTLWLQIQRNFLSPFQLAFDMPVPFTTVGERSRSNLPAQALILLNDPFVIEQARHWSTRVRHGATRFEERVAACYRAAYSRAPEPAEVAAAEAFFDAQGARLGIEPAVRRDDARLWDDYCHVLWNVKEFYHVR